MTDTSHDPQIDVDQIKQKAIDDLQKNAVSAALAQQWEEAISVNLAILKLEKTNIAALNRLGFAYVNAGKKDDARKTFEKVKKIDPYNQIANKNLYKLDTIKSARKPSDPCGILVSPIMFLEDPGKTKISQCVNVAPAQSLLQLSCGQEVFLKPKNHCVEIRDVMGSYLGALPDDLSFRLIKYLDGNNKYHVYIKSVDKKSLTVFIRETSRGKKFAKQPSFASAQIVQSYNRNEQPADSISDDKPDVSATGEEVEEEE